MRKYSKLLLLGLIVTGIQACHAPKGDKTEKASDTEFEKSADARDVLSENQVASEKNTAAEENSHGDTPSQDKPESSDTTDGIPKANASEDDNDKILCGKDKRPVDFTNYQCVDEHWVCTIAPSKAELGCLCGEYLIPNGTQCIDEHPACEDKVVDKPISGFGCYGEDYLCQFHWGCIVDDNICYESQKYENGKCVDTRPSLKNGETCQTENCRCGKELCAKHSKCENGECNCVWDNFDCPYDADAEYHSIWSGDHGSFVCKYHCDCGTSACGVKLGFSCSNPNGCYIGRKHYMPGTDDLDEDYKDEWLYNPQVYYDYPRANCPYHYDGDSDPSEETVCPLGDCVVPLKHGLCGVLDIHQSITRDDSKNRADEFDANKCPGGTRYCHGRKNQPMAAPKYSDGYLCVTLQDFSKKERTDIKAWQCQIETCLCGNKLCPQNMVCMDDKCIRPEEFPDENGHVTETPKPDMNTMQRRADGSIIYDVSYYTQDPDFLDYCGRKSAEALKQVYTFQDESIDKFVTQLKSQKKIIPDNVEFDRCLIRRYCDTWGVPRANRDQYVCDHGYYTKTNKKEQLILGDRPLGLRCIDPAGCVCGETTCREGALCMRSNTGDYVCKYDSVYMHKYCHKELYKDSIESMSTIWDRYAFYEEDQAINCGN